MGGGKGGGGGGFDASAMVDYGQQALALQREVYDDTIGRSQPWYDAGTGSISKLSDLLGINGGSMQSRDQIYNTMMPQYTTQQANTPEGPSVGDSYAQWMMQRPDNQSTTAWERMYRGPTQAQETTYSDVIDYDGLNAAVDSRFGEQGTPEGFGSLLDPFSKDKFETDPGYQFRLDEGNKALERQMAASGKNFTPEALKALSGYNSGMASQEYNTAYDRYNIDQNNLFNRLAAVSGIGQTANQTMANSGSQLASQGTGTLQGIGNAITSAQVAKASQPSMFGSLLGAGAQLAGATYGGGGWSFSDRTLKENIKRIGEENGHTTYVFNYKGDETRYIGVMAQDVLKTNPEAVVKIDGFLAVDYDRIGVKMREAA